MISLDQLERRFLNDWVKARRSPEGLLYHYTTAEGFVGILRSNVLRGTSAAFLNDESEVAYGFDICRRILAEEKATRTDDSDRLLLADVERDLEDDSTPEHVFVVSFSELPDDLGQWRGYGETRRVRYCFGFAAGRFSERDWMRFPMPVVYDAEEQSRRIRGAIATTCEFLREAGSEVKRGNAAFFLAMELRRLVCLLKAPGFSAEREWRSIDTLRGFNASSPLDFGITPDGVLKPSMPMLRGSRESERLPIVDVIVLPPRHAREAIITTRWFLDKHGYGDVHLERSKIPFTG